MKILKDVLVCFDPRICSTSGKSWPWNEHDDAYVLNGSRPAAESGASVSGHGTNAAGIDLGEKVWSLLGMTGNNDVEWEFV